MAEHTPGPWRISNNESVRQPSLILGSTGAIVATTRWDMEIMEDGDEETANANLIAAAPEMLAALKEINQHLRDVVETNKNGDRNNWEGYYLPEFEKLSRKFSEIIRKAEGE